MRPETPAVCNLGGRRQRTSCWQIGAAAPRLLLLMAGLAGFGPVTAAGPTVAELLAVCDRAFATGYTGLDAAACEWYAAPCACKVREPGGRALRWCVPDSEPIDDIARKVVAALRNTQIRDAPAEAEVQGILERLYPCAGPATR